MGRTEGRGGVYTLTAADKKGGDLVIWRGDTTKVLDETEEERL